MVNNTRYPELYPHFGNLYQPAFDTTEYVYAAAMGYDANYTMFLRGSIGDQWLDTSNASCTPDFVCCRFDMGICFSADI